MGASLQPAFRGLRFCVVFRAACADSASVSTHVSVRTFCSCPALAPLTSASAYHSASRSRQEAFAFHAGRHASQGSLTSSLVMQNSLAEGCALPLGISTTGRISTGRTGTPGAARSGHSPSARTIPRIGFVTQMTVGV